MLDCDGVIFQTYNEINTLHRAVFGRDINWKALKDGTDKYWTTESGRYVMKMFKDDLFYAELQATKGCREALKIFMRNPKNSILYCTARDKSLEEATAYSIGRNGLPCGDIAIVPRENCHIEKFAIAVIEGVDVCVDDETLNLFTLKDQCITICFTQDYNKKYPFGLRAENWNDVHKLLTRMQQKIDEGVV